MTRVARSWWAASLSVVFALVCRAGSPVAAAPATLPVEVLQIGSRWNLGLGGDPFLSLSMGETGWWESHSVRAVRVRVREHLPITRRLSGDRGALTSRTTDLSFFDSRRYRGWRVSSELVAARQVGDLQLSSERADFRLAENGVVTSASILVESASPRLAAKVELPLARASASSANTPVALGLRAVVGSRLWLSARWRSGSFGVPFDSHVAGETLHASFNARSESSDLLARARVWRGLALETSYRGSTYEPGSLLTDVLRDELLPQGDLYLRQTSLEWRGLASRYDLLARHTNADLRASAEGHWGGQRYLRVSHSRAHLDGWLFASQIRLGRDRLQLEYGSSNFSGFARFDVEGWRFGQSHFIAGKQVVQGGGDGKLHRYRLGYEMARTRARLRSGFTWYEIRPSAELESWIKVVLVRRDYERREADGRYSIAAVSLGGDLRWRELLFKLDLHQFVHYDDHVGTRPAEGSPGEPGGPGEPSEPIAGSPSGWFGGTYIETSLSRSF